MVLEGMKLMTYRQAEMAAGVGKVAGAVRVVLIKPGMKTKGP